MEQNTVVYSEVLKVFGPVATVVAALIAFLSARLSDAKSKEARSKVWFVTIGILDLFLVNIACWLPFFFTGSVLTMVLHALSLIFFGAKFCYLKLSSALHFNIVEAIFRFFIASVFISLALTSELLGVAVRHSHIHERLILSVEDSMKREKEMNQVVGKMAENMEKIVDRLNEHEQKLKEPESKK